MRLNLPAIDALDGATNILIAGAGGGFDIFAGLPLYHELKRQGKRPHLFNYSFTDIGDDLCSYQKKYGGLYEFSGEVRDDRVPTRENCPYFPEGYLAEWFSFNGDTVSVWATAKVGVASLSRAYKTLIEKLELEAIVLVDGGVDSLMKGNEAGCGTILEDTVSLAASLQAPFSHRVLACLGFGTELDDGVNHYRVLENMSGLVRDGAFHGACALTEHQEAFQFMADAYKYVVGKPGHAESHITPRIIKAVEGVFGDDRENGFGGEVGGGTPLFHSALMSLFWFFDAGIVAARSKLIDAAFNATLCWTDVAVIHRQRLRTTALLPNQPFPY